jgi:hypothetical protein
MLPLEKMRHAAAFYARKLHHFFLPTPVRALPPFPVENVVQTHNFYA